MTKKVIETVNGWYMENPKQKVELDDIVGLVKTDEPTDSVQLKKEAQLSICEKRIIELEKEIEQLKQQVNCHKSRIQLLSPLLDLADTIIDLSDDEKAKAFWEKRNNEVEQEWNKILKGDVE